MVPRYSRPDMVAIWTPEARFKIWFEIEAHATDALAELGVVPKEAAAAIWEKGAFEVDRIDEIERETKHDVIAFLTNVAEHVGPEARFMHQGMTSSDVLDTCLAVQLAKASDILIAVLQAAQAVRPPPEQLLLFGDSQVVINDVLGTTPVGAKGLETHRATVVALLEQFNDVSLRWLPRHRNGEADRLSQLAIAGFTPEA